MGKPSKNRKRKKRNSKKTKRNKKLILLIMHGGALSREERELFKESIRYYYLGVSLVGFLNLYGTLPEQMGVVNIIRVLLNFVLSALTKTSSIVSEGVGAVIETLVDSLTSIMTRLGYPLVTSSIDLIRNIYMVHSQYNTEILGMLLLLSYLPAYQGGMAALTPEIIAKNINDLVGQGVVQGREITKDLFTSDEALMIIDNYNAMKGEAQGAASAASSALEISRARAIGMYNIIKNICTKLAEGVQFAVVKTLTNNILVCNDIAEGFCAVLDKIDSISPFFAKMIVKTVTSGVTITRLLVVDPGGYVYNFCLLFRKLVDISTFLILVKLNSCRERISRLAEGAIQLTQTCYHRLRDGLQNLSSIIQIKKNEVQDLFVRKQLAIIEQQRELINSESLKDQERRAFEAASEHAENLRIKAQANVLQIAQHSSAVAAAAAAGDDDDDPPAVAVRAPLLLPAHHPTPEEIAAIDSLINLQLRDITALELDVTLGKEYIRSQPMGPAAAAAAAAAESLHNDDDDDDDDVEGKKIMSDESGKSLKRPLSNDSNDSDIAVEALLRFKKARLDTVVPNEEPDAEEDDAEQPPSKKQKASVSNGGGGNRVVAPHPDSDITRPMVVSEGPAKKVVSEVRKEENLSTMIDEMKNDTLSELYIILENVYDDPKDGSDKLIDFNEEEIDNEEAKIFEQIIVEGDELSKPDPDSMEGGRRKHTVKSNKKNRQQTKKKRTKRKGKQKTRKKNTKRKRRN